MKKSIISILQNVVDRDSNYLDHFIIGIDMDSSGSPLSSMMLSHGKSFATVGMIDVLIKNLQDVKKDVLEELSTKNQKSRMKDVESLINNLPSDLRDKVLAVKKKVDDAIISNDLVALEEAKKELENLKISNNDKHDDDNDDDHGFNIVDFKGGIA